MVYNYFMNTSKNVIDIMDIAKKIIEYLGSRAYKKLERNHKILKILKALGSAELKKDIKSVYAHALVEYAVNAMTAELVTLFALKEVKDAFQTGLYKDRETEFDGIIEDQFDSNEKVAFLKNIYKSAKELHPEIQRFRQLYDYFTLQTADEFQLKKYNEDKKFQLEMLEEKQRKSFDFQADRYLSKLIEDFHKEFLKDNRYIDLNAETRVEKQTPVRREGLKTVEKGKEREDGEPAYDSIPYRPMDTYINEWLRDNNRNFLVIVGEYGTGKTTFLRRLAHQLASNRLEPGSETAMADPAGRLPLFFPLRDFEKRMETYIVSRLHADLITDIDFTRFQERIKNNECILLLDGFDEMTQKVDADEKGRNFDKIRKLIETGETSKIILTTKQEYFRSTAELREVFKHGDKTNYDFIHLLPFDDGQIQQYLKTHTDKPAFYWEQIEEIFDLHDLAKRPVLLELIVKYLPGLVREAKKGTLAASDLYERCINDELGRKSKELQFIVPGKYRLDILQKLAVWLFLNDALGFDTGLLESELNLKRYFQTELAWEFEKYLNEFLTFTFLIRESDNRYRMSHKSFRDYLTAQAFVREINTGKIEAFAKNRLTKEVRHFMREQGPDEKELLKLVLTARNLSEETPWQGTNAANFLLEMDKDILKGKDLSRCQLSYVDFEGCDLTDTNLQMADLSYCMLDDNIFKADFTGANFHGAVFDLAEEQLTALKKRKAAKIRALPLDVQFFDKIINDDFIYVDKTGFIAKLINTKLTYFFLSRPRRFGKSLLVSTMREVFRGNKELFKNLEIYDRIDWQSYPVIYFDFSLIGTNQSTTVELALADEVDKIAVENELPITPGSHKTKFRFLIEHLSKKEKKPVVILIDEYDKFIIDHITDGRQREINRTALKDFFSVLKGLGNFIRFLFITGVSRFTRVSIFSDLNNLIDLTFEPEYAAIAGYTEKELLKYFSLFIDILSRKENSRFDEMFDLIRDWYNGYSWDGHTRVHNPYSILKLFSGFRFGNHWYSTGTPTFLIKAIRERKTKIQELDNIQVRRSKLEDMEVSRLELIPLLFQTGYLTITGIIKKSIAMEEFILDYPNRDVRYSFLSHLLEEFSPNNPRLIDNITTSINENRIDEALGDMRAVFAAVPYNNFDPGKEASYHALIHVIFILILDNIGAEIQTNLGRLDEVVETEKYIYIFEFKMDDAQKALAQIHEKKYYEKYEIKKKNIVLVGVGFSKEERNIKEWIIEKR